MSDFTITIVGTGLIGTSIGLALKQQDDSFRLLAHDKELSNAKTAVKMGAFDKQEWNLINACEPADLIILAIPLSGVRATLDAIGPYLKENAVVTDTCTGKVQVLAWVDEFLPDNVHFVGGNPVVHPSGSGPEQASADLFKNRLYCLTPAPSANEEVVQLLVNLVDFLGASPFFLNADEHDGLITAVDYLPSLMSVALVNMLARQQSWRETRKLAGKLFERVSFGADGDPDTLSDLLFENKVTLAHWLDHYIAELNIVKQMLLDKEEPRETMAQEIDKAIVARLNWLKDFEKGTFLDPELSSPKVENPGLLSQMVGFGRFRKAPSKDKKE